MAIVELGTCLYNGAISHDYMIQLIQMIKDQ